MSGFGVFSKNWNLLLVNIAPLIQLRVFSKFFLLEVKLFE